jgi:predicted phage terminase large subunit-like protein
MSSLLSSVSGRSSRVFKGHAMSPARFAESASKGKWKCPRHLQLMNEVAVKVATGEILRHMTFEPPQTGKSEFWSKWFPVWCLGCFPDWRIILGSYNADYAAKWGGYARDCMAEFGEEYFGLKIRPDRYSRDDWSLVGHDGGMRTMGMDGGITGHPSELFLIDDPFKGPEDSQSLSARDTVWNIFTSCCDSRLQPGGRICGTWTPWHHDDLGGRLLKNAAYKWSVLRMPALGEEPIPAEERAKKFGYDALKGAPDPLGRKPGEALWRDRFNEQHYETKRILEGHWFDAIYQCHPHPRDGGLFKRGWFDGKIIDLPHREASHRVRYWDTAASEGSGDWTVGVLMSVHNQLFYVEHVERFRSGPGDRDKRIRDRAILDKAMYGDVETWIEQSGGGGGKTEAQGLVRALAGVHVQIETQHTNKLSRAIPFASQCQAGNVKLVAGDWVGEYLDELCAFKGEGKKETDDQVDGSSGAFKHVALDEEPGGYAAISDAEAALAGYEGGYS